MLALQIDETGPFMSRLLLRDSFDRFLVSSATITTFTTFSIDGNYHPDLYDTDTITETETPAVSGEDNISWKSIRPFCLQIMKGKRLPLSFQIVLFLPHGQVLPFLERHELSADPESIFGLFLNIHYKNRTLTVTTGTSVRGFSMDRSIEQAWDADVRDMLKEQEIL
jgi:hypothetical protein